VPGRQLNEVLEDVFGIPSSGGYVRVEVFQSSTECSPIARRVAGESFPELTYREGGIAKNRLHFLLVRELVTGSKYIILKQEVCEAIIWLAGEVRRLGRAWAWHSSRASD
jgi:hypothetical protein